jgi:hypothetical protein
MDAYLSIYGVCAVADLQILYYLILTHYSTVTLQILRVTAEAIGSIYRVATILI